MISIEDVSTGAIEIRAAEDGKLDVDAYNAFVAALQLASIELVRIQGERTSSGVSTQSRFDLSAGYMVDGKKTSYRYDVTVRCLDEAGQVLGGLSASVLLVVSSVSESSPACLERFGATSGALMVHPYLREAIASTAQRIGFSGVLLPMMTFQPSAADPE